MPFFTSENRTFPEAQSHIYRETSAPHHDQKHQNDRKGHICMLEQHKTGQERLF